MARNHIWPDATHELLLGLCLQRERVAAILAWKDWKARVDLDDLDHSSFQIMSLICCRLLELGIDDPDLPRIKGLHRYLWTHNQIVSRGKCELLDTLHRENILTLLLQGAALGQTVYPEPAARGLHDMAIAVPIEVASHAVNRLGAHGWTAEDFDSTWSIEHDRGCRLRHARHGTANLRWRIMRSRCPTGRDEELWQAAQAMDYKQIPTRVLCPADQFLHACEVGMHHSSAGGPLWLVDCAFIIRHSPAPIDWSRLIDQSKKFQLTLHARETLFYLHDQFEDSIPGRVIDELKRAPLNLNNRIEYFLAGRSDLKEQDLTHKLAMAICRYRKLSPGEGLRQLRRDCPRLFRLLFLQASEWPSSFRKFRGRPKQKAED